MEAEIGNEIDPSLLVRHFQEPPSPAEFSSHIENTNVPAAFYGSTKDWKAISKWNPFDGGLDYLEERVGSAIVEAMVSKSGSVFYGDIRSHERVPIPFSTFISSCKKYLANFSVVNSSAIAQEETIMAGVNNEDPCSTSSDTSNEYYVAQVAIFNSERKETCPLEVLSDDIQKPVFLKTRMLTSINFWMNRVQSRSSTHYDPHHNLLCMVAGSKQVSLWPPSAYPLLYPMAIYGEASNHSAVDLENPDILIHPRAEHRKEYSQKIILHSGDSLFIPEGWFHQVDSDDLTIAVNFWWKSEMMSNMLEHMDAYYLRRILNRLMEKELNQMLKGKVICGSTDGGHNGHSVGALNENVGTDSSELQENSAGNGRRHGMLDLDPKAFHVLYDLVSLVHDTTKVDNQTQDVDSSNANSMRTKGEHEHIEKDVYFRLESDIAADILLAVDPLILRSVLLGMVNHFPRTLETLILHMLSPKGAEVLTRKFDEMDQQITKEEQDEFYHLFYGVFDDQCAVMDKILNGKELFAFQLGLEEKRYEEEEVEEERGDQTRIESYVKEIQPLSHLLMCLMIGLRAIGTS